LEDDVKKRRTELAAEEKRMAAQLEELGRQRQLREQALQEETKHLEQERDHLKEVLEQIQTQIRFGVDEMAEKVREQVPLLAALSTGLRATTGPVVPAWTGPGPAASATPRGAAAVNGEPPPSLWSDVQPIPPDRKSTRLNS